MIATAIPVAVRVHTEPLPALDAVSAARPSMAHTRRASRGHPPRYLLVLDAATTADLAQRLTVGGFAVYKRSPTNEYQLVRRGLIAANDLTRTHPRARAALEDYAAAHNVPVYDRRAFMNGIFYKYAYELRARVIGFGLPFVLARLGVKAGRARRKRAASRTGRLNPIDRGGFSVALFESYSKRRRRWVVNEYRPRLIIKSINGRRAFTRFARPRKAVEYGGRKHHAGDFVDVGTMAFALSGDYESLASLGIAFGIQATDRDTSSNRVTHESLADTLQTVGDIAALYLALEAERDRLGLPVAAPQLFSPASLSKAAFSAMGIEAARTKAPTITVADYGRCASALNGGIADGHWLREPQPVVTLDVRSMHSAVFCNLGLWPIVTAAEIALEDCTDEFRALLDSASVAGALDRAQWLKLACFVEVDAQEDVFPVRGQYLPAQDGLTSGHNALTAPQWFSTGPDVYGTTLLTGRPPRIRRAVRLVSRGVQEGLHPIHLGGTRPVDPRVDNPIQLWTEDRARIIATATGPRAERDRMADMIKVMVNSATSGIWAELNREDAPTTEAVAVHYMDQSFAQLTPTPEVPGPHTFMPIAALVSGGARLKLILMEKLVTDAGGTFTHRDTDAIAIVASKAGGVVESAFGPIRILTHEEVTRVVQARFNQLNPFDRTVIPQLLRIEKENYVDGEQRDLYAFVASKKRYALITYNEDGAPQLVKASEHGLGHLMSPLPVGSRDKWPDAMWNLLLARELGMPHAEPDWLYAPAVSRVPITTPAHFDGILRRYKSLPYPRQIKPFGSLLTVQLARFGDRDDIDRKTFRLVAPFSRDPRRWRLQTWTDAHTGGEYGITTGSSYVAEVVKVKSIGDVLDEFIGHGERTSARADGKPAGPGTRGLLQRRHVTPSYIQPIGKESNQVDLVEARFFNASNQILTKYGNDRMRLSPEELQSASAAEVARRCRVSVRTVRRWRKQSRAGN